MVEPTGVGLDSRIARISLGDQRQFLRKRPSWQQLTAPPLYLRRESQARGKAASATPLHVYMPPATGTPDFGSQHSSWATPSCLPVYRYTALFHRRRNIIQQE